MATSTELLRAAEHMRQQAIATSDRVLSRAFVDSAEMLEAEVARLQSPTGAEIVIQIDGARVVQPRTKCSWPEGWPPFAVLRRAYESIDAQPWPSTKWCERRGARRYEALAAGRVRADWRMALEKALSNLSSP